MLRHAQLVLAAIVVVIAGAMLRADTYHNQPDPSATGGIVGKIKSPEGLQTVIALDPTEFKCYQAKIDSATGKFEFKGLPPAEYDLLIKLTGKVYEGISIDVDPEAKPTPVALKKDLDDAGTMFFKTEDYFNIKHVSRFNSAGDHARMLVIQTRTKPVVDPAGNKVEANVRRIDFVDLVKTRKVWQVSNTRHLLRQEIPYASDDNKLACTHSPQLGAILVGEKIKDLGEIDLAKLSPSPKERFVSTDWKEK